MIDTTRIRSEFDLELLLGSGWFLTAIRALHNNGLLLPDELPPPAPPDAEVVIVDVQIIFEPNLDLQIDLTVAGFPLSIKAALTLSDDGSELFITTDMEDVEATVPFDVLDNLAGPPVLQKVAGEGDNAPAIAVLANLNLRASPQSGEPLPADQHVERGDTSLAQSFLPSGQDMVLGVGEATYQRFANDIWHTPSEDGGLRAEDGSHPLPDADNKRGDWSVVSMTPRAGRIRVRLEGDIPVDSPIFDLVPDPHVTITLNLIPTIENENVSFTIEFDADVDTGLLGDLFVFLAGGFLGFIIGLFTGGGAALASSIGLAAVIALEIAEVVVEGKVERRIRTRLDGELPAPILTCHDDVVVEASAAPDEDSLSLGLLDAISRSIPIFTDRSDALHQRSILVTANFNELQMDGSGMAIAGPVTTGERFQPNQTTLVDRSYSGDDLVSLTYRTTDGTLVEIPVEEVLTRMAEAELVAPFKVQQEPGEAEFRTPEGRLASVCLSAQAIRRRKTIVTEIQFSTGVDLKVRDSIMLQDAGALIVRGLQLIHPKNYNAYYRTFADDSTENNFESLPSF
jgi:hypothetical protein